MIWWAYNFQNFPKNSQFIYHGYILSITAWNTPLSLEKFLRRIPSIVRDKHYYTVAKDGWIWGVIRNVTHNMRISKTFTETISKYVHHFRGIIFQFNMGIYLWSCYIKHAIVAGKQFLRRVRTTVCDNRTAILHYLLHSCCCEWGVIRNVTHNLRMCLKKVLQKQLI